MRLCFATQNQHKIQEVKQRLKNSLEIFSLTDLNYLEELPETSDTLEGNSFQKASFCFSQLQLPCFADDSGLEVFSLNNAPGVYSARYAGDHKNSEDNIDLLLKNLSGATDRSARFRTVITLVGLGETMVFEGRIRGTITHERHGNNGFGYDAVFIPEGETRTFAEMSMDEKNARSHRSIAVAKLIAYLSSL